MRCMVKQSHLSHPYPLVCALLEGGRYGMVYHLMSVSSMRYVLLPNTSVALWRCVTPNVGKTRTTLFLPFLTHPSAHTKGCWCSGLMMLMIVGRMDWIWMAAAYWYWSWLLIVLVVDFVSSGTETWVGSGKSSLFAQAETNNLKLVDWLKALNKILRLNALSSLSHLDLSLCLSRRKKKLVWEWKRHNIPPEYFPMCPSAVKGCIIILPSSRVPSLLCVRGCRGLMNRICSASTPAYAAPLKH